MLKIFIRILPIRRIWIHLYWNDKKSTSERHRFDNDLIAAHNLCTNFVSGFSTRLLVIFIYGLQNLQVVETRSSFSVEIPFLGERLWAARAFGWVFLVMQRSYVTVTVPFLGERLWTAFSFERSFLIMHRLHVPVQFPFLGKRLWKTRAFVWVFLLVHSSYVLVEILFLGERLWAACAFVWASVIMHRLHMSVSISS